MITVFIVAFCTVAGAALIVSVGAAVYLGYLTWRERQRDIGYNRGALDYVLDTPDEAAGPDCADGGDAA